MKITVQSTTKITRVCIDGEVVPARVWEGTTDSGIPVHAYITRISPQQRHDLDQFDREFEECAKPSAGVVIIPDILIF